MSTLSIKLLSENAELPRYDHTGDSGLGLVVAESVELIPFKPTLIKHDIALAIPEGYEAQIRPRSSTLFKRGIHVALGTIDQPYRGPLMSCALYIPFLALQFGSMTEFLVSIKNAFKPHVVEKGERISQLVVSPVEYVSVVGVDSLDETSRGEGGFGSTGK